MKKAELQETAELKAIPTLTKLTTALLLLTGFLFILLSLGVPDKGGWSVVHGLLKELGIVLMAVFGVSLIYELLLAKRYIQTFLRLLRDEIEKGESNAAACALLGVKRIFPTRDAFEKEYPLLELAPLMRGGARLRVVARSLFLLMSKAEAIQQALTQGAHVELCLLSPDVSPQRVTTLSDLVVPDIQAAVLVFRKKLVDWINTATQKPSGSLQLRYHDVDLFDSWFLFLSPTLTFGAWDLSFGRDVRAKRVFVIDPAEPLGADLVKRYDQVFQGAHLVFQYDGASVLVDAFAPQGSGAVV